jgi:YHS domain-containing protein
MIRMTGLGIIFLAVSVFPASATAQTTPGPAEALDGVDPVVLIQSGKPVDGKPEFTVVRGRFEYRFSSADTKAAFEKSPERYEIQFGGACARMGPRAGGNPADYLLYDGKIYIFGSDDCRRKFSAAPEKFLPKPAPPMPESPRSAQQGRALIERAVKAIGGAQRLDSLTTYIESAKQVVKRPQGETPVTTRMVQRFPGTVRIDRTTTVQDKAITSTTLITPEGAWFIGQGRPYPMNPAGREAMEVELGRQILPLLRSRQTAGVKVAALELDTIEGVKMDRVRIQSGGVDVALGLDRASGQVRSMSFTGRSLESELGEYTLIYSDYRNVDGLMLPFSVRALFNGTPDGYLSRTIDSIAINHPLDSALFEAGKACGQ